MLNPNRLPMSLVALVLLGSGATSRLGAQDSQVEIAAAGECPRVSRAAGVSKVFSLDVLEFEKLVDQRLGDACVPSNESIVSRLACAASMRCAGREEVGLALQDLVSQVIEALRSGGYRFRPDSSPGNAVKTEIRGDSVVLLLPLDGRRERSAPALPTEIYGTPETTFRTQFYTQLTDELAGAGLPQDAEPSQVEKAFPITDDILLPAVPLVAPPDIDELGSDLRSSGRAATASPPSAVACAQVPFPPHPNDPQFLNQHGLRISCFPEAWEAQSGSSLVTVALVDSGLATQHPDIESSSVLPGANFCEKCPPSQRTRVVDDTGHGTAMAGIVGATTWNSKMIAGANWQVQLLPLKFLQEDNLGTPEDAAQAICQAAKRGASLILASWGGSGCDSPTLKNAIVYAKEDGVLFVTAAGNDTLDLDQQGHEYYPAIYSRDPKIDNMIVVGATRKDDKEADYTNRGMGTVHLGAPGVRTPVLAPGAKIRPASGTSVAAAYVAGAAALVAAEWIKQHGGRPPYLKVKDCLLKSVAGSGLPWSTGGRLDAYKAVKFVANDCQPPPPP